MNADFLADIQLLFVYTDTDIVAHPSSTDKVEPNCSNKFFNPRDLLLKSVCWKKYINTNMYEQLNIPNTDPSEAVKSAITCNIPNTYEMSAN